MPSQKIENLLNLALDATPEERRKSLQLDVGYEMCIRDRSSTSVNPPQPPNSLRCLISYVKLYNHKN